MIVNRDDAVAFLETACRNWRTVPKLSRDDLEDVAGALRDFLLMRIPHIREVDSDV